MEKTSFRTSCLCIRNGKLDMKWSSRQTKSNKESSSTAEWHFFFSYFRDFIRAQIIEDLTESRNFFAEVFQLQVDLF